MSDKQETALTEADLRHAQEAIRAGGAEPITDADLDTLDSTETHPFDVFRCAVVVALGLPYATGEMFGGYRYPTDAEIVSWVELEHKRVRKMHDGHHAGVVGICPACGMYGKGAS